MSNDPAPTSSAPSAPEQTAPASTSSHKTRECPACRAGDLHPSRHRGFKDALMKLIGKRPYRCHRCQKRFYFRSLHTRKAH